jgi:hypothetical protein
MSNGVVMDFMNAGQTVGRKNKNKEKLSWRKRGAKVGECCKGCLSVIGLSSFGVLCPSGLCWSILADSEWIFVGMKGDRRTLWFVKKGKSKG